MEIQDRILLKKAAWEGCCESLAMVYIKYQPAICDYLRKSGAGDISEDLCQSVFMELRKGRCRYDGKSDVKNYLFGIAGRLYKNEIRARKTKTCSLSSGQVQTDFIAQDNTEICPLENLQTAEFRQFLTEAASILPPKANQAINLVYFEGIPAQTAAGMIGVDFKVFRDRLDFGLRKLRKSRNFSKYKSLINNALCMCIKIF